jgi:hypothetical protein
MTFPSTAYLKSCATTRTVRHLNFTKEAWVQTQDKPRQGCYWQRGIRTCLSPPTTRNFPCHNDLTNIHTHASVSDACTVLATNGFDKQRSYLYLHSYVLPYCEAFLQFLDLLYILKYDNTNLIYK